jgi:FkbM family methyltransferase
MPRSIAQRLVSASRDTPGISRLLYGARAQADRALMTLQRPPLSARVEDGSLSGYLRHRGFLAGLADDRYEHLSRDRFIERIRPGTTVVDGGAHIGLFTLLAARRAAPGKVYAFEADPYNFDALRLNATRNGLDNVRLVNEALADTPGPLTFMVSSGTVASSLVTKSYVHDAHPMTVPATTIDAEVPRDRARDIVVKLDVEGAEERVLKGAAATLQTCLTGTVIAEQNPAALADAGSSGEKLVALLRSFGFTRFAFIDDRHDEVIDIADRPPDGKGNLLAYKDSPGTSTPGSG